MREEEEINKERKRLTEGNIECIARVLFLITPLTRLIHNKYEKEKEEKFEGLSEAGEEVEEGEEEGCKEKERSM